MVTVVISQGDFIQCCSCIRDHVLGMSCAVEPKGRVTIRLQLQVSFILVLFIKKIPCPPDFWFSRSFCDSEWFYSGLKIIYGRKTDGRGAWRRKAPTSANIEARTHKTGMKTEQWTNRRKRQRQDEAKLKRERDLTRWKNGKITVENHRQRLNGMTRNDFKKSW